MSLLFFLCYFTTAVCNTDKWLVYFKCETFFTMIIVQNLDKK